MKVLWRSSQSECLIGASWATEPDVHGGDAGGRRTKLEREHVGMLVSMTKMRIPLVHRFDQSLPFFLGNGLKEDQGQFLASLT